MGGGKEGREKGTCISQIEMGLWNELYSIPISGTGSGVGTRVLEILKDEFPEVYRFTTAVFPSADDDVITSPYNRSLNQFDGYQGDNF